jgi:hypothetical protein
LPWNILEHLGTSWNLIPDEFKEYYGGEFQIEEVKKDVRLIILSLKVYIVYMLSCYHVFKENRLI